MSQDETAARQQMRRLTDRIKHLEKQGLDCQRARYRLSQADKCFEQAESAAGSRYGSKKFAAALLHIDQAEDVLNDLALIAERSA
jgi:hypothetical protein